ncbi:hypothetical protein BKA56DRAFT_678203 [Ilyonectria sp. MPI-CAGE-AT-0026]|nr:hypothetical protein BKA56DRAFT_678203 [Ilyonectria sp. MPI-CAGE-AT-0026]
MTVKYPTDRQATMEYIRPDSKMNRRYMAAGEEVNTGKYETKPVLVHDARHEIPKLTLDTTGFELFEHESKVSDWSDMAELESTYSDEIHDFVSKLTGADKVIVFGPVRRTTDDKKPDNLDTAWNDQPPASDVHVDYTPRRAECLAEDFAAKAGFRRSDYKQVKLINLWRAVKPGPQNWPLALCRGDIVGDDEGVINDLLYVDKVPAPDQMPDKLPHDPMYPEGSLFTYRPTHRWMYYSSMDKDELLAFTLYDSKMERPWRVPHCAFYNDAVGAKKRESVEIRTACYFK